jgi:hypothetical protein
MQKFIRFTMVLGMTLLECLLFAQNEATYYQVLNAFLAKDRDLSRLTFVRDSTDKRIIFWSQSCGFIDRLLKHTETDVYGRTFSSHGWRLLLKQSSSLESRPSRKLSTVQLKQHCHVQVMNASQYAVFCKSVSEGKEVFLFSDMLWNSAKNKCFFGATQVRGWDAAISWMVFMEKKAGQWQMAYLFSLGSS